MTRDAFTCSRCGATLATVRDRTQPSLLIAPGVAHVVNLVHRNVRLTCACGTEKTVKPPRGVQTVVAAGRHAA